MNALATPLAQATTTYHQFARAFDEPWKWGIFVLVCAALIGYVVFMYLRDSVELSKGLSATLMMLRVVAFAAIAFFFLSLERMSQQTLIKHSRIAVLVDTSQSMAITDATGVAVKGRSRIDEVVDEFTQGKLLEQMRKDHEIVVYRFDEGSKPVQVAAYGKLQSTVTVDSGEISTELAKEVKTARTTAIIAGILFGIALVAFAIYLFSGPTRNPAEKNAWTVLVSMVAIIAAIVVFGIGMLRSPDVDLLVMVGLKAPEVAKNEDTKKDEGPEVVENVNWTQQLLPRGTETRIGDVVRFVVRQERGGPLAGIVLLSDGGNNKGVDVKQAINDANDANIKLFVVGLGSQIERKNVRVVDIEAPPRVYPGDKFHVTGFVQAFGLKGRRASLQLVSTPANNTSKEAEVIEDEEDLRLQPDGQLLPHTFEVKPEDEEGKRIYTTRVVLRGTKDDSNIKDNQKSANVEIIDRRTKVLLLAGGPTREYRFLRNFLYRDKDITLDVLLQTGEPGISQESDELLFDFPELSDELFEYDCIIAFDPDWLKLNEVQVKLLERWIAEKSGGMIVVAGPVFTHEWTRFRRGHDSRVDTLKALYPVVFYNQGGVALTTERFGGESPWPLNFTREGESAEFLWLEDDAIGSEGAWASFDGVFGFYKAKDPKPGAKVYAHFSDPDTKIDDEFPIYMAGHLYGSGRVFYQASGEMWRVREVDDTYFQTYYTKLIRWASQGRLLQDSSHGSLLVDKERCLIGDHIAIQAILQDAQHRPLAMEEVKADLIRPDGARKTLMLRKAAQGAREGMFTGQFTTLLEGDYEIELQVPGTSLEELLTRTVRTRVPQLESENPKRNDQLMQDLAQKTKGQYYVGLDMAMNRSGDTAKPLMSAISPQDQIDYLPGTRDRSFEQKLMGWLMTLICGVLCLEWLLRRISKLA